MRGDVQFLRGEVGWGGGAGLISGLRGGGGMGVAAAASVASSRVGCGSVLGLSLSLGTGLRFGVGLGMGIRVGEPSGGVEIGMSSAQLGMRRT